MLLEVRLLEASCTFEVSEKGSLIVSGEQGPRTSLQGPCRGSLDGPWLPAQPCPHSGPSATPPTGKVYQWEDPDPKLFDNRYGTEPATPVDPTTAIHLRCGDVYKELQLQGFNYGPNVQGILETSSEGRYKGGPTLCFGANSCCLV